MTSIYPLQREFSQTTIDLKYIFASSLLIEVVLYIIAKMSV